MDKIKRRSALAIFLITGFITGFLTGAAAVGTLASYRIDSYHARIRELEISLEDRDVQLEKLKESINKSRFVLKDIEIVLEYDGDEIDRMTIEKHIKNKYRNLLGKEVRNIDTDILIEVIDKRIFKLEEREYSLKVNRLVLAEILKLWISAEEKS
ncbi:MAG TPA: hypothetical protein GXX36_13055 [Clostridiaceae bacterium]|nr:hypothetical protein [Clostridiaceae bacterium]